MKPNLSSFSKIVKHYISNQRCKSSYEIVYFKHQPSLKKAIYLAALAKRPDDGKRSDHQRRIPPHVLRKCEKILTSNLVSLKKSKTFEELHEKINSLIFPISGVGKLMVYDTALRIGAFLRLSPRHVFLHTGTLVGARHLGIKGNLEYISPTDKHLPPAFSKLMPREIEDVLCIYSDEIKAIVSKKSRSGNFNKKWNTCS